MKKLPIFLLAGLMLTGAGCSDYLDEDTTGLLYGPNVLSTQDGLESALTGAYKGLANQWGYGFLHPSANAAVLGADDVTTHPASNKADWREFDQFNVSTTNQRSNAVYNGCYKAIQGANNVINNWEKTQGYQGYDRHYRGRGALCPCILLLLAYAVLGEYSIGFGRRIFR
jgi:hypothetical protein